MSLGRTSVVVFLLVAALTLAGGLTTGAVAQRTTGDAGDSRGAATTLDTNSTTSGTISLENDTDWYAVDIEKGEGIFGNLTLTSEGTENLRFDIFTPDGERIGEYPNDGMGATYVTNRLIDGPTAIGGDVAEQSGTYYVRVKRVKEPPSEATNYELSIDAVSIDRHDPNEQPATASNITLGESVSGNLTGYDRDVYAVDLRKGETVTVDFIEQNGVAFPWLYVFNPALPNTMPTDVTQYEVATVGTFNETTTFTANEMGTYYVSVVPFYDDSTLSTFRMNPRYEFTVSVDGQGDETGSSGDDPTETASPPETAPSTQTRETTTPTQPPATDTPSLTATVSPTTDETTVTSTTTTPTATTTTQQPTAATGAPTTATDGPGFGLLAALFGLGIGGWLFRRRE